MKKLIFAIVVMIASVANAGQLKFLVGDEFAMADLTLAKVGPIEVGFTGAVDYFVASSSTFNDLDIDFGDDYEGLVFKAYAPIEMPVRLYGAYKPMIKDMHTNHMYNILEAGVEVPLGNRAMAGICFQHCDEFVKDDRIMLSTSWLF